MKFLIYFLKFDTEFSYQKKTFARKKALDKKH